MIVFCFFIKFTPGVFPFSKVPKSENPKASAPFLLDIFKSVFKSKSEFSCIILSSSKMERELLEALGFGKGSEFPEDTYAN